MTLVQPDSIYHFGQCDRRTPWAARKRAGLSIQPEEGRQSLTLRSLSVSAMTETELKVIGALQCRRSRVFAPRLPRLFSNRPCSKAATPGPRESCNSTVLNMFSAPLTNADCFFRTGNTGRGPRRINDGRCSSSNRALHRCRTLPLLVPVAPDGRGGFAWRRSPP